MAMQTVDKDKKPHMIFSDNEKMDKSGMAGKPIEYETVEWKMPTMTTRDMVAKACADVAKSDY